MPAMPIEKPRGRVLLGLSGGVDSAVCAALLLEQGWEVQGAVLDFSPCHAAAVKAAQEAAEQLGIPLHVLEAREQFEQTVIRSFARSYQQGETPNPCIACNPAMKFRLLVEKADELGFDRIATGHYAGVFEQNGRWLLRQSAFLPRDQSYMLYRLTQRQLSMLLLPLEGMSKDEVRQKAKDRDLSCAQAPDSQEICFISGTDYAGYIERHYGKSRQGRFLSPEGSPVGWHKGILHYTVGQRKHLGVALGRPVFIRKIDAGTGDIYLGDAGQEFARRVIVRDAVYLPYEQLTQPIRAFVKVRSRAKPSPAEVIPLGPDSFEAVFEQPERAPAPGQSCVLYNAQGVVLGGGYLAQS